MPFSHSRRAIAAAIVLSTVALLMVPMAMGAQKTATWTGGGGDGSYNNPANWDIDGAGNPGSEVPVNGSDTYLVHISAGVTVNFDVPGSGHQVTQFTLPGGSILNVNSGRDLEVVDAAAVSGVVNTVGGTFLASSPATTFPGNAARATVSGSGRIDINAPSYASTGINGSATLFSAGGAGSRLDLTSLQSINAGVNLYGGAQVYTVHAANDGVIDLSALQTVTAPYRETHDRLDFVIETGGYIDLGSLQTTTVPAGGVGYTRFDVRVPAYALPSLITADRAQFVMTNGTTLDLGDTVTPLANPATQTGGSYSIADNATVNFPALTTLNNATLTFGANSTLVAPNLTNLDGSVVSLDSDDTFTTGTVSSLDAARLAVADGVQWGAAFGDLSAVSYSTAGFAATATLFSATGAGSLLDLATITTLNAGFNAYSGAQVQTISAADGATIDLSGLTTVTAPYRETFDLVRFVVDSGGHIDLGSLSATTVPGGGTGHTKFEVNVPAYALPALQTADRALFVVANGTTLDLGDQAAPLAHPATQRGGGYDLDDNAVVNFPALTNLENATVTLGAASQFHAPNLTNFAGSVVHLEPGRTFDVGALGTIDAARISVSGGTQFGVAFGDVAATSYSTAAYAATATLFSADGAGSVLDLSSLTSINAGFNAYSGAQVQTISATDGGAVDLSNVTTVTAPYRETIDVIEFVVASGGDMDLASLGTTTVPAGGVGYTRFDVQVAGYSLPALTRPDRAQFIVAAGTTLDLGDQAAPLASPATQDGGRYDLADGATVNFPALTGLRRATVTLGVGADFNAPNLTDFDGSVVDLAPGRTFTTGTIGTLDAARIAVSGGVQWGAGFGQLAATGYSTAGYAATAVLFSADGAGSLLDLSSITSINAGFNAYSGSQVQTIRAVNGGRVDLSGVTQVVAPYRETIDRIDFVAASNGTMDLSSLQTVTSANIGQARFTIGSGGTMIFGDLVVTDELDLSATDNTSTVVIRGGLNLDPTSDLSVTNAATLQIAGNFSLDYTDTSKFDGDTGIMQLNGSGAQLMEVGGADLGAVAAAGNFGLARLIVGGTGTTSVTLVDLLDNGDQSGAEALYLLGSGGLDGLQIVDDSILMIGDIPVYAWLSSHQAIVELHSLFGPGDTIIAFPEPGNSGFIAVPEPATVALLVVGACAWLRRRH